MDWGKGGDLLEPAPYYKYQLQVGRGEPMNGPGDGGEGRKWQPGGLEEGLTQTTEVEMMNDGGPH